MTIRIKISNEDSREAAIIRVKTIYRVEKSQVPRISSHDIDLKGGESKELNIYDGMSFVVEELQNG